jgi:hypothetical protein
MTCAAVIAERYPDFNSRANPNMQVQLPVTGSPKMDNF